MMIRDAGRDELGSIRILLAKANETSYDPVQVAEEKCFGSGVSGPPRVRVAVDEGVLAGIAVTCGRYLRLLAVDRMVRRRGIGSALLRDADEAGVTTVFAEPGNYFTPGVDLRDRAALAFFERHGFATSVTTQNLEASRLPAEPPPHVRRAEPARRERLLEFVERHFGKVWRFECARAMENEPPTVFYVADGDEIAGFSAHEANNRGLGCFGPTGVSESKRGRGLGSLLLQASLADLRRLGFARAIIPWTDAIPFYQRACGATVAARFAVLRK